MKIAMRKEGDPIEFTGWKIVMGKKGPIASSATPDLPRQLAHVPYCLSAEAVVAYKEHNFTLVAMIACASLLTCAWSLAPRSPTIAAAMLRWADEWSSKAEFNQDQLMRMSPDNYELLVPEYWEEYDPVMKKTMDRANRVKKPVRDQVVDRICTAWSSDHDESAFAVSHNWASTVEEWNEFTDGLNGITIATDDEELRKIAPARLRGFCV